MTRETPGNGAQDAPADHAAMEAEQVATLPPELRFLKWLVIVLTAVMIIGITTIMVLLAIRLGPSPQGAGNTVLPSLPENIALPGGVRPAAVTFGPGWIGVVDEEGTAFWVFDADTGALRQRVAIE